MKEAQTDLLWGLFWGILSIYFWGHFKPSKNLCADVFLLFTGLSSQCKKFECLLENKTNVIVLLLPCTNTITITIQAKSNLY